MQIVAYWTYVKLFLDVIEYLLEWLLIPTEYFRMVYDGFFELRKKKMLLSILVDHASEERLSFRNEVLIKKRCTSNT